MTIRSFILVLGLVATPALGQVIDDPGQLESDAWAFGLDTEVGILSFENQDGDGERFLSSTLAPSLERGLWSVGLRLRYRWNHRGVRDEDWDDSEDVLAILRYLQYGTWSETPVNVRVGDIDHTMIGHGQFFNRYRNTLSLDTPNTGIQYSRTSDDVSIQSLFGSISDPGVFGARVAFTPASLGLTTLKQEWEWGVTLAGDASDDARLENEFKNGLPFFRSDLPAGADSLGLGRAERGSPLTMLGFDAGFPVQTEALDNLFLYAELGNIFGFGSGLGIGARGVHEKENMRIRGWVEQRILGEGFFPSYFNSRYERDRLRSLSVTLADDTDHIAFTSKRNLLHARDRLEFGSYIGMDLRLSKYYRIRWSLEHSWNRAESGWFELDVRVSDPELPFQVRWVFDRVNMNSLNDIVNGPSENGLTRLEAAYQYRKYILVGFRYRQSFETVRVLGRIEGQEKRSRVEPAIIIRLQ